MLFPKGKKWRIVLALALLLLLGISTLGSRVASGLFTPFSKGTRTAGNFISLMWENIFHSHRLDELQECEIRLTELEVRKNELDTVKEENRQLRSMLKLPEVHEWKAKSAELIMRDPAVWNWNFKINLGEADGIVEGAPVLFGQFLVGRVGQLFNRSATVETLANPACAVGVYVFSGDNVYAGILKGNGQPSGNNFTATVEFLPKNAIIEDGATVSTSGMGTEVPGGLPIGVVHGNGYLVDDARMSATVLLNADLRRIKFVSVLFNTEKE